MEENRSDSAAYACFCSSNSDYSICFIKLYSISLLESYTETCTDTPILHIHSHAFNLSPVL
jgi:hypothetical protein